MPTVLNTYDLSVLLSLSPDEVNALARKGVIKGYKIGRRWRFRAREVHRFLDDRRDRIQSAVEFGSEDCRL